MAEAQDPLDPRGLIRESYRIDGITDAECRSIFMDWALGTAADADQRQMIAGLLERYGAETGHPMTAILRRGLDAPPRPGRRGGRAGRQAVK